MLRDCDIVPLTWYPRLWHASGEERRRWRLIGGGLGSHWPDLDEDISDERADWWAVAPVRINAHYIVGSRVVQGQKTGQREGAAAATASEDC